MRGEATITAYPTYISDILQPIFQPPVRKVVPIDGKAAVEFDLEKELKYVPIDDRWTQGVPMDPFYLLLYS